MTLTLPILAPLLAAALCVAFWGRARLHGAINVGAMAVALVSSVLLLFEVRAGGVMVVEVGGWAAPFGIALVADLFSAIMVVVTCVVGTAGAVFSLGATPPGNAANGHHPLSLCLIGSVAGAFLSGDLFNLYVWFELMLLSSFVLLTLGAKREQLEGAIKYVTLNLISSVLFLASIGLIYSATGTLNMAHLAIRLDEIGDPAYATALGAPLLAAFCIKAAVFPAFFWLPASYHTAPPAVAAIFAGLLTKVGVYSIIRAATLMFDQEWPLLAEAVLWIAGLTMLTGVLGAVAQNDMRRILSFHIVSQIGYMLMGLGIALAALGAAGPDRADAEPLALLAMTASVFYIVHHILAKTNLFFISGVVITRHSTADLGRLSGLRRTDPALAALFLVSAFSLAGIPILSGFWPKLALVRSGLQAGEAWIVAVSLVVSLLTLYSMTKIWTEGFWGETPEDAPPARATGRAGAVALLGPIAAMAALSLAVGLGAAPLYELTREAAAQLLDPSVYIDAVFPGGVPEPGGEGGPP